MSMAPPPELILYSGLLGLLLLAGLILLLLGESPRDVLGRLLHQEFWPARRIEEDLRREDEAAGRREQAILEALAERDVAASREWRQGPGRPD
jgi:hypothetical protein